MSWAQHCTAHLAGTGPHSVPGTISIHRTPLLQASPMRKQKWLPHLRDRDTEAQKSWIKCQRHRDGHISRCPIVPIHFLLNVFKWKTFLAQSGDELGEGPCFLRSGGQAGFAIFHHADSSSQDLGRGLGFPFGALRNGEEGVKGKYDFL